MQGTPTPTPQSIGAQPFNADLQAIASLTPSAGGFLVGTGSTWAVQVGSGARGELGGTTVGQSFFTLSNPSIKSFPLINPDNTVTARLATDYRGDLGLGTIATQSAASVAITGGSITGITDLAIADGGTGASTASAARANLGATTVGGNLFTLPNPGAIRFPRINADNSVSSLSATDFREAIDAANAAQGALAATAVQPDDLGWTKIMDLISINDFTPIGAPWPNELWINSEGLKLVRFGLGRATNPGLNVATIALSWSGYPSNGNWDKLVIDNNNISRIFISTTGGVTSLNYIPVLNNGTVNTVGYFIYL